MILYFTGTGNSKYVADALAHYLEDDVVSLNERIKNQVRDKLCSKKPYIVVTPIYAWRMPRIVEDYIRSISLEGSRKLYFVLTNGGDAGRADKYCEKLSIQKEMEFKGVIAITMPSNYIVAGEEQGEAKVSRILEQALQCVKKTAEEIEKDKLLELDKKTWKGNFLSTVINPMFNRFSNSAKEYVISEECVSCGKCQQVCPVNNVELENGKPLFGNQCINCYACIQRCPKRAINIKGKTENRRRYTCPEFHA